MYQLSFSSKEIETIKDCFKYVTEEAPHSGSGIALFPNEQILIHYLGNVLDGRYTFTHNQINMMYEWVESTVLRRYGSLTVFFGVEKDVYEKLKKEILKMEGYDPSIKK